MIIGEDQSGQTIHIPFCRMLPMLAPLDIVVGGWDISSKNLAESMARAKVLDL